MQTNKATDVRNKRWTLKNKHCNTHWMLRRDPDTTSREEPRKGLGKLGLHLLTLTGTGTCYLKFFGDFFEFGQPTDLGDLFDSMAQPYGCRRFHFCKRVSDRVCSRLKVPGRASAFSIPLVGFRDTGSI